jgi:DNA-binding Lrp family transcriptional regulator
MAKPGQKPRITPEDVEAVFDTRDDVAEPLTASEIGEELNCTRRTALNKLNTLQEDGAVESKKVGGRARVWWLPIDRSDRDGHTEDTETVETDAPAGGATGTLFYDIDLPSDGANLEARRDAVQTIYEYLKEHGSGRKSDFADVVDAEACGYGGDDPFNSFWTNCVVAPKTLAKLPDVEAPGEGGHFYQYVGDRRE